MKESVGDANDESDDAHEYDSNDYVDEDDDDYDPRMSCPQRRVRKVNRCSTNQLPSFRSPAIGENLVDVVDKLAQCLVLQAQKITRNLHSYGHFVESSPPSVCSVPRSDFNHIDFCTTARRIFFANSFPKPRALAFFGLSCSNDHPVQNLIKFINGLLRRRRKYHGTEFRDFWSVNVEDRVRCHG